MMYSDIPLSLLAILIGLVLGSFTTMLCYRIPRDIPLFSFNNKKSNQSDYNFSFCRNCQSRLKTIDLIPIFSWIIWRGQCRHCHQKISVEYPVIEWLTAVLVFIAYSQFGFSLLGGLVILASPVLVALLIIDWQFRILPNILNLTLFILGFMFQWLHEATFLPYLMAAFIYPFSMMAIRWIFLKMTGRDGLGMGDIKFFAAAGIWLGLDLFSIYLLLISILGIGFGLIYKIIKKEDMFPFGPALIVAFLICFYAQSFILRFI